MVALEWTRLLRAAQRKPGEGIDASVPEVSDQEFHHQEVVEL